MNILKKISIDPKRLDALPLEILAAIIQEKNMRGGKKN
jgi:hypothetical protein